MKLTATLSHNHGHRRAGAGDGARATPSGRTVEPRHMKAFHFIHVLHVLHVNDNNSATTMTTATSREATEIICLPAQFAGKCRQINLQLMNSKSLREGETE